MAYLPTVDKTYRPFEALEINSWPDQFRGGIFDVKTSDHVADPFAFTLYLNLSNKILSSI